jgi:hypothetical protein
VAVQYRQPRLFPARVAMLRAWPLVLQPRISATGERTTASNTSSINVSGGKDAKTNEENMTDQRPIRISKADRQIIERMAAGWRPLKAQIPHGNHRTAHAHGP